MRLWPFGKKEEQREIGGDAGTGAVSTYVNDLSSFYGTMNAARASQTGAVEFALGTIARAFMQAQPTPALPALDPSTLAMMGFSLMAYGNSVWEIAMSRRTGQIELLPVASYEIRGGRRRESWVYLIEEDVPLGVSDGQKAVMEAGLIHIKYLPRPDAPWAGISPLRAAGLTSDQLAKIEQSLKYDASVPTGALMPLPDGISSTQGTQFKAAASEGKGGLTGIETTGHGWGQGMNNAAPRGKDFEQARFGAAPPAPNIELRNSTSDIMMGALGTNPSLLRGDGAAVREAFRHLNVDTIKSLGTLIAAELSLKLEEEIELHFPQALEGDLTARARAFKGLIEGGVPAEEAARICGLPPGIDFVEPSAPMPTVMMESAT